MFTNWLTDTTGLTNARSSRLSEKNHHLLSVTSPKISNVTTDLSLLNGHNLTNLNSNIMTHPPDIILEVGPAPTTVRFMAHGLVLGMHSGYLRSAIRLDERGGSGSVGGAGISSAGVGGSNVPDIIVYLTNVTPEQFAPLLTYMYTGYLDLNVENIFGVLLATHVLHMPRALEICRSFLARAQTEGYFAPNNAALTTPSPHVSLAATPSSSSGKIIRPIASKPQLTNFGFLPMGHQPLALKSLPVNVNSNLSASPIELETKSNNSLEEGNNRNEEEDDIEVDEVDKQSFNNDKQISIADDEEEDVEVFIDSNSETEVVVETQIQKLSFRKLMENKKSYNDRVDKTKHHEKSHHKKPSHHSKTERRKKVGSSGLQVAKAPIPASQLDCSEANKVIIDVASCDGPVRFKRILNTAYGHKPDACHDSNSHAGSLAPAIPERSLQSVSLSFHQQMAKTISQQQQQLHNTEESENSETSNGSMMPVLRASEKSSNGNRKSNSEVFVCVYCKHTFKSQYCYQKHAKRHLNPLTLQATCVPEGKAAAAKEESCSVKGELQITKHQNVNSTRAFYNRPSTHSAYPSTNTATNSNTTSSSDYLRREVRPLDMNVQYYPCKTCGCKFPSYYFVHKHRKMCHAEEEAQQSGADNNSVNAAQAASAVVATATTVASVNDEECLNSQSSD